MNLKQQLRQDMREAMRVQDRQRVNTIRMLLTECERAQEALGKQTFEAASLTGATIRPDRQQILSEQVVQDIICNEVQRRREAVDILRAGGRTKQAESEGVEIAILERYLAQGNDSL